MAFVAVLLMRGYACKIFHVSALSRIDGATACLCLYSSAELAFCRRSRIEW